MTREEIRSLIGGYATGSLSAAEREALFEAALDDQELFDELAREQALKELLDQPGVKPRLLEMLAPQRRRNAWVWAAAGAFAIAVIAGIMVFRTPPPQQLARVIAPAPAAPETAVVPQALPVERQPAPVPRTLSPQVVPPRVVPSQAVPLQIVPPQVVPPQLVSETAAKKVAAAPPPEPAPQAKLAESAPVPAPAAPAPAAQLDGATSVATLGAVAGRAPAGGGGGRGGGRGGAARAMTLLSPAAAAPARFAFDYSLTPEGNLRIVPAASGFLTVGVGNGNTISGLVDNRPLQAGSVTVLPLPADAVVATVIFSAQRTTDSVRDLPDAAGPASGTKSDPNPSPNSFLSVSIRLKP